MSSSSRAWMATVAVGAVETMKDQGLCRWNYALRSIHQHAKNKIRSSSVSQHLNSRHLSSSSQVVRQGARKMMILEEEEQRKKRGEESLKTVMYLSCWGPYN